MALTAEIRAGTLRQPVPRRGSSQGVVRLRCAWNPPLVTACTPADAGERPAGAPGRVGSPRGPRNHDGTIIPKTVDTMWGTDLTTAFTGEGQASVLVAVDHCAVECVGIHAHAGANRFEALEPIRQGIRRHFVGFAKAIARGLAVRHDYGSQYMSDHFQKEIAFLGIESSPAFVRAPEALGETATSLKRIAAESGPEAVAFAITTSAGTAIVGRRGALGQPVDQRVWITEQL